MKRHVPVLLNETRDALALKPDAHVVDGTLGDAGHAEDILRQTSPNGKLIGIDADPESLLRAKKFLHVFGDRVTFVRDNFVGLADIVRDTKIEPIHGVLLDLGWSTPQFEERQRGFSFQKPGEPLDMRYDKQKQCDHTVEDAYYDPCTAASIVNGESEKELTRIFKQYGEERFAKEIAQAIVEKRSEYDIETVGELVEIILSVYRKKLKSDKDVPWVGGIHPATKVFQALRISVNEELTALARVLPQAIDVLVPGGRLAVISFHSVEDGIVKHYFKKQNGKTINIITKKPVTCSEQEAIDNPPSRSAKLRVVEKR